MYVKNYCVRKNKSLAGHNILTADQVSYRIESGQAARLRQYIIDNNLGHALERDNEYFPWRPYSLQDVPVFFDFSVKRTKQGQSYAENVRIDIEMLILELAGEIDPI